MMEELKRIATVIAIVALCVMAVNLISCATSPTLVPVIVKPVYPMIIPCPELPNASDVNADNVADVMATIIADYRFCSSEVEAMIIFNKGGGT
jgi:hypothetical protein